MLTFIQFGLYLGLMLFIGYRSMKKTGTNEDFIIGGRKLGVITSYSIHYTKLYEQSI